MKGFSKTLHVSISSVCSRLQSGGRMGGGMDKRRAQLEEDFFHRQNREQLEKIKESMKKEPQKEPVKESTAEETKK